jgi:hypothetical protein
MKTYILDEIPIRSGIHCSSYGVRWIAKEGVGRSNVFLVTPDVQDIYWKNYLEKYFDLYGFLPACVYN